MLANAPAAKAACEQEGFLGSLCETAARFCPIGTLPAQGQILSIGQNQGLYSLLHTTYGGDGQTTFALPDLRAPRSLWTHVYNGMWPEQTLTCIMVDFNRYGRYPPRQ
ncbi:MAG: tail fiber protein [Rhodospirillales bacterium]|nr:tail fiber protein [Rhodospirillales bacterium]